jgi:hypothetical protein
MESYNFIKDESELKKFYDLLEPLNDNECRYLMISARKKYLKPEEKSLYNCNNSDMLMRVLIKKNGFDYFKRKVLSLCLPIGTFTDKNGKPFPSHIFTIYMTENARCMRKASVNVIKKLAEQLYNDQRINLEQFMMSEIHKSPSEKIYCDFDIDPKDNDNLDDIIKQVKYELRGCTTIDIKTHSGAHIMLNKNTIPNDIKNTFYRNIKKISESMNGCIDFLSDGMIPLPGTTHGNTYSRVMDKE